MNMKPPSNIQYLNNDVMFHIFSFLNPVRDILSTIPLVCRHWYQFIWDNPEENHMFQTIDLRTDSRTPIAMQEIQVPKKSMKILIEAIRKNSPLKSFHVFDLGGNDRWGFTLDMWQYMNDVRLFSNLESFCLDFEGYPQNTVDELLSNTLEQAQTTLKTLKTDRLYAQSSKILIQKVGSQLEDLHVDQCMIEEGVFDLISDKAFPRLKSLSISELSEEHVIKNIIKNAPNINHISISGFTLPTEDTIRFLHDHCPHVDSISIECENLHESDALEQVAHDYPNLKSLYISGDILVDQHLASIQRNCKQLERIVYDHDQPSDFSDILDLIRHGNRNQFKYISISVPNLYSLPEMAEFYKQYCPLSLEYLNMVGFSPYFFEDDQGHFYPLYRMFHEFPNLQKLAATTVTENPDESMFNAQMELESRERVAKKLCFEYNILMPEQTPESKDDFWISHMFDYATMRVFLGDHYFDVTVLATEYDDWKFEFCRPKKRN